MDTNDSTNLGIKTVPDFSRELELIGCGKQFIAGVDEAGRGPLAGPVVVCAVVLDANNIPNGLNDSKKLSPARREVLFEEIISSAQVSIISVPPLMIEQLNIRGATLWGMVEAVRALPVLPHFSLIDGRDVPDDFPSEAEFMIKGDGRSVSIAAASIVAKVTRDRMCAILDFEEPNYGFGSHKGYGTAQHLAALQIFGACPHHRALFAPVAKAIAN